MESRNYISGNHVCVHDVDKALETWARKFPAQKRAFGHVWVIHLWSSEEDNTDFIAWIKSKIKQYRPYCESKLG